MFRDVATLMTGFHLNQNLFHLATVGILNYQQKKIAAWRVKQKGGKALKPAENKNVCKLCARSC